MTHRSYKHLFHNQGMSAYPYSYDKGKYWVELERSPSKSTTPEEESVVAHPLLQHQRGPPVSHFSDTGQFNSNAFFFIEGLESEEVQKKINSILESTSSQSTLSDIVNLENEDIIASFVFKYVIQNNFCDFHLMDKCLTYLARTSQYFADKVCGKLCIGRRLGHLTTNSENISRCSYKFCAQTYCCQFNYPEGKRRRPSKGCYSDHFPHSKVYQDIVSLQNYIKRIFDNTGMDMIVIRSNQEIIKCINTIAYVIKHMYDELWNIYISCKREASYEKQHRNLS